MCFVGNDPPFWAGFETKRTPGFPNNRKPVGMTSSAIFTKQITCCEKFGSLIWFLSCSSMYCFSFVTYETL